MTDPEPFWLPSESRISHRFAFNSWVTTTVARVATAIKVYSYPGHDHCCNTFNSSVANTVGDLDIKSALLSQKKISLAVRGFSVVTAVGGK